MMDTHPTAGIPGTGFATADRSVKRVTPRRPSRRLYGVDAARAIAVAGMAMVHFGPAAPFDTVLGSLYGLSGGRASVLFVLLAGVGVALLAGHRSGEKPSATLRALVRRRLLWREALLLPLGLWLQQLDHGVLVILQYYALYFLFAALVLTVSDRWLLAGTAVVLICGPLVYLTGWLLATEWYTVAPAMLGDPPGKLAHDLVLSGAYPLVTWAAPLLFGLWIGRRDLSSAGTRWGLLAGGTATALGAELVAALVATLVTSGTAWSSGTALGGSMDGLMGEPLLFALLSNEPHSQMPLWMVGSIGAACAVLGGTLLVADRLGRAIWPLAATGQMALSVYVGHLLLLGATAGSVRSEEVPEAFFTVGAFMLMVVLLCVLWRAVFDRGPLEAIFVVPRWVAKKMAG